MGKCSRHQITRLDSFHLDFVHSRFLGGAEGEGAAHQQMEHEQSNGSDIANLPVYQAARTTNDSLGSRSNRRVRLRILSGGKSRFMKTIAHPPTGEAGARTT